MSDLSLPLLDLTLPAGAPPLPDWPGPPLAAFEGCHPVLPADCTIEGTGGRSIGGQLLHFAPALRSAELRLGQRSLPFAFDQIRRLTLTAPLPPRPGSVAPTAAAYRYRCPAGQVQHGLSLGHRERDEGLYLYLPHGETGAVRPVFVPQGSYSDFVIEELAVEPVLALDPPAADPAPTDGVAAAPANAAPARTVQQLIDAIAAQQRMPVLRLGEALRAMGLIGAQQLEAALERQRSEPGVPLGQVLVRSGAVSAQDLQAALARKMGYPQVDVMVFTAEVEALRCVPFALAHRLQALPLLRRGAQLVVALDDPTARGAIDELEFVAQARIVPALAPAADIARALPGAYERYGLAQRGEGPAAGAAADAPALDFDPADASQLVASLELQHGEAERDEDPVEQSDNSLVKLVNTMIVDAWMQRVSDIHIETQPGREKLRIRFRRDGVLRPYLELPHTYRAALVARIKIMCELDISERRKPQDGKINFARYSPQHRLELRVATIPTANGLEDVVLRILASHKPLPIEQLGLAPANLARLREAIHRPYGMVLCVGPTGSGKTTTLHSALGVINTPERKIWTAEDPVEITQRGLRQVQVNPKIDWTFAKALRAFLRADPDVIMVGEIRDQETAQVAIEASLTGHLVLSTLHTNSAPETVTRLLDMGMDPFNFADSLLAVLAQRLVRRLCPHCRSARPATAAEVEDLLADHLHAFPAALRPAADAVLADWVARHGQDGRLMHHEAAGCPRCDGSGYAGRVGIHELLLVTPALRQLVVAGGRVEPLREQAIAEGMRTLRQDGIDKVLQGLTTIAEVRATSNA
jgi:type II secretory ATPase GspE/PulE/Tfp pilus assembly ATPase PilB-like protein